MVAPREVNLTTTQTTTLADLNGRTFTHPTTNFDLLSEFSLDELSKSLSLQTAVAAGDVELRDEDGVLIPKVELLNVLHNFYATTDPTVNDDADDGYTSGSYWINRTTDNIWFCVDSTVGAAIWKRMIVSGGQTSGVPSFSGSFYYSSTPYLETNNNTWDTNASWSFEGTDTVQISSMVAVLSRSSTNGTSYIRIYDATNNNTIAEISYTSSSRSIYVDTTLANLPTTRAIFDIQTYNDGNGKTRLWSLMVY